MSLNSMSLRVSFGTALALACLAGTSCGSAQRVDGLTVEPPPPSPCAFVLDPIWADGAAGHVYAATRDGDPAAAERALQALQDELAASVPATLHRAEAVGVEEGSGARDDTARALRAEVHSLAQAADAPLRVGPTRFYLAEDLAALGAAAAVQRGDIDAARAWLNEGGVGRGDAGRLPLCRVSIAVSLGEPVDAAWLDNLDVSDPEHADWVEWLRNRGLVAPADRLLQPDAAW